MTTLTITTGLFYVCAALALISALFVVGQRNPTYSAFALIVTLGNLAVVYGLLGAPFIAVLQIIVYAGAIMVLFLFVLMLLDVKREQNAARGRTLKGVGVALGVLFALQVGTVMNAVKLSDGPSGFMVPTRLLARRLFSVPFLYVFEATSILILAALVGAIVLAQRREPS